ncbi:MAG: hypothetical protein Q4B59_00625 [Lachnospiraceae bacterium]|nr:hypothetical protein [Lachnospiraceae bacterium]
MKRFRKSAFVILMLVAVLVAAIGVTWARYTSQDHQRSVVRNRDSETIRFSSDKLFRVTADAAARKYYDPVSSAERTITFQICNYDQSVSTLFCEKNIEYDLTVKVTNGSTGDYTISRGSESKTIQNNGTAAFTGTLAGGKRSVHAYSIVFHESDFNKVNFEVSVVPKNLSLTQNRVLKAVLIPIENASLQGFYVTGEYSDASRGEPDDFAAFNYSIRVTGGSGQVVLTWNADQLDIDPFFKTRSNATGDTASGTLTIPMDSEDSTASYQIPFYNKGGNTFGSWEDLGVSVSVQG